ncbi:MAG: VIT1/CCC1 transporter family protein, partial [Patescibacteria group bacterium]
LFAMYARNFIFGAEDSLVSTVGLLSGIAAADVPRATIALTGIVLIFVEAFSMAAGSFLSEYSAEEYIKRTGVSVKYSLMAGAIMFFTYFIIGFIPLLPYMIFDTNTAMIVSIILALISLCVLGLTSAKIFKTNLWRSGLRMFLIGGLAVGVGVMVGRLVK